MSEPKDVFFELIGACQFHLGKFQVAEIMPDWVDVSKIREILDELRLLSNDLGIKKIKLD